LARARTGDHADWHNVLMKSRCPRKQEPVLWVIDSEQWPRACLRAELIERGYDAHGFITIDDALDSLSGGTSQKRKIIIPELRGQNLTAETIEAIRNLQIPTDVLEGIKKLKD